MRCKPGDIAILIHSPIEENIGAIVDVIEAASLAPDDCDQRPAWHIQPKHPLLGYDRNDPTRTPVTLDMGGGIVADADLQPIRGLDIDSFIKEKEPEKCSS